MGEGVCEEKIQIIKDLFGLGPGGWALVAMKEWREGREVRGDHDSKKIIHYIVGVGPGAIELVLGKECTKKREAKCESSSQE